MSKIPLYELGFFSRNYNCEKKAKTDTCVFLFFQRAGTVQIVAEVLVCENMDTSLMVFKGARSLFILVPLSYIQPSKTPYYYYWFLTSSHIYIIICPFLKPDRICVTTL